MGARPHVKGTTESAGKRDGPAGTKLGTASRRGACSDAAGLCLRHPPAGPQDLTTREKTQGQGQAFTRLAPTRGRAVYDSLTRHTAFAMRPFRSGAWRGEGSCAPHWTPMGSA